MEDRLNVSQIHSQGYGIISKMAMQDRRLDVTAKAIYAYFNSFAGSGNTCFPSREKICFDLDIGVQRYTKCLKQLVQLGYIQVKQIREGNRYSHNVYTICSELPQCVDFEHTENQYAEIQCTENHTSNNNSFNNNKTNNNSNKKERKTFNERLEEYTDNQELRASLIEYIKMRVLIKAPMTDRAITLLLNDLDKLASSDADKIKIVNQSIVRSWKSVYPLQEESKKTKTEPELSEEEKQRRAANLEDFRRNKIIG